MWDTHIQVSSYIFIFDLFQWDQDKRQIFWSCQKWKFSLHKLLNDIMWLDQAEWVTFWPWSKWVLDVIVKPEDTLNFQKLKTLCLYYVFSLQSYLYENTVRYIKRISCSNWMYLKSILLTFDSFHLRGSHIMCYNFCQLSQGFVLLNQMFGLEIISWQEKC